MLAGSMDADTRNGIDLSAWLAGHSDRELLRRRRDEARRAQEADHLGRDDLAWARRAYVEGFLFGYDSAWFDRDAGRFDIDRFLDDGETSFGGYDLLILWQPYPRMGIDPRSQIDFWRDWPGGLRELVARCHDRGVRCLLNHVRWDVSRPHGWANDMELFGRVIEESDADGIYLDTLHTTKPEVREALDRIRPGLLIETEYNPTLGAFRHQSAGWSQGHDPTPLSPFVQRWVEPRAMIRLVNRGASDRTHLITKALFFGHGICVWENVFGWWNPFTAADRAMMQRVVPLLREHRAAFCDLDWEPLPAPVAPGVFANRWRDGDKTLYTLLNTGDEEQVALLPLDVPAGRAVHDVWNGQELQATSPEGSSVAVPVAAKGCGCVVVQPAGSAAPLFAPPRRVWEPAKDIRSWPDATEPGVGWALGRTGGEIKPVRRSPEAQAALVADTDFRRRVTVESMQPRPVAPAVVDAEPADMVRLPGGRFVMSVTHTSRKLEGGCYGDPQSMHHPIQYHWLPPFLIDRTPVTNAAFARFLADSNWRPRDLTHFLDHWEKPDSADVGTWQPPAEKTNHPVVWVDLEDARAYARWAGRRLSTEPEWQFAAQGFDRRRWPWGDTFEPGQCNHDTADTTPVDAFPGGASPFGVLDLTGNVWEWTESERNDGHTRYAILRGGSHLFQHGGDHPEAWGKMWYTAEGAQPNDAHQKMLLIAPGLDRCATVGFRCAADLPGGGA